MDTVLVPVACLLLLTAFLIVIVHPILTARHAWQRPSQSARQQIEWTERKEQLYSSIRELEFDHSVGKVSDTDFAELRHDLEQQALTTLKRLDAIDAGAAGDDAASTDVDARIEADLQSLSAAPVPAPADTPVAAAQNFCPSCGARRQPAHRFCAQCGNALETTAS